jgi:hypothetical protein
MRKPRDIDSELKALQDRAKALKAKRIVQLGELIVATGADALDIEILAGMLVEAVESVKQSETKEAWRRCGAAFFQRRTARKSAQSTVEANQGAASHDGRISAD